MPASKGVRNPALLHRPAADTSLVPSGTVVVCAHKPLRVGYETFVEDERIPGAAGWDRLDARIRARIVKVVPAEAALEHAYLYDEDGALLAPAADEAGTLEAQSLALT